MKQAEPLSTKQVIFIFFLIDQSEFGIYKRYVILYYEVQKQLLSAYLKTTWISYFQIADGSTFMSSLFLYVVSKVSEIVYHNKAVVVFLVVQLLLTPSQNRSILTEKANWLCHVMLKLHHCSWLMYGETLLKYHLKNM